ncbi:hypothetical protein KC331_g17703 [Hortaea werneckii]|nr:hypothetical protein KC338_g9307 [Hortaea werneckii]KAI7525142.1 hypothetical protein KC331_g17703 [Hortaea werneckii]KAI7716225.1 hypothetical protein KC353_g5547 [Hortaea werneckii]
MTSGYNSRYEINEGQRNDFAQDDHEESPVSNGCSSSHEMDEGKRNDFTRDDHDEPPVANGYFGNADPVDATHMTRLDNRVKNAGILGAAEGIDVTEHITNISMPLRIQPADMKRKQIYS